MKIAIITHPLKNNYGGILQNWALQQVLKRGGNEVYSIDKLQKLPLKTKILSFLKNFLLKISGKNVKLKNWLSDKDTNIIDCNTREFVKNEIVLTETIFNNSQVDRLHNKYMFNCYIVGSDQVWRRNQVRTNDLEFLEFLKENNKVKKIAYAASFGVDFWEFNEKETLKYKKLAKLFDAISVREDSGVNLCNDYLKVEAEQVIDPTLLLSKDDYIKLVNKAAIEKSEGNLFCYILDKNNHKNNIVEIVAREKKLKAFEVMPKYKYNSVENDNIENCVFPKVETWIRAFMDAEFVVTDSFHGTAFSIIFNKPFIAILNKQRGASRFYSLLKLFSLEDRIIIAENEFNKEILNRDLDYDKVNSKLQVLKSNALNFINLSITK
ncbi:Polysaccharide pyruvyl transferase [Chryseobacterium taichungense]|uniref:Polysaccharide pyruvyl transferase n=1 Tax=Chryseobacterium taichungense TaxID=295069 RepID=A0A1H7YD82_9FLAO|nr:polysaccharide pyruvyl transferase family protein [Chryseobacterium taichungense]SEM43861.1 Polysaccharide pyruvyl transferase [Chryseobacterium taichungense]